MTSAHSTDSAAAAAALRASSPSSSAGAAAAAAVRPLPGDLAALERAAAARATVRAFDASRPVPRPLLARLLAVTRASPSGFNLQPYAVVLVDAPGPRERLAAAMLGGNAERVRGAPLAAVFLADAAPLDHGRLERVVAAERAAALGLLGPALGGLPDATPPAEWAAKQAGLASMSFMLAAAAGGLATCAMEGLRPAAVRAALRAPGHYTVAMVVAVGYAAGGAGGPPLQPDPRDAAVPEQRARRLPAGFLFRDNAFDVPWAEEAAPPPPSGA